MFGLMELFTGNQAYFIHKFEVYFFTINWWDQWHSLAMWSVNQSALHMSCFILISKISETPSKHHDSHNAKKKWETFQQDKI